MPKCKTEQSVYECLLGFCFNNIFCRHKFWLHRQFSSAPIRNEEMMGDGFRWCYCCRFVLNSKRLLSTSCNSRTGAVAISIFSGVIPVAFEVRRIVCVKIKQT